MKQRRSTPCDNCPAKSRLHRVKVRGRTLDLCMNCLKALRKIQQDIENASTLVPAEPANLIPFPQGIDYNPPR